MRHTRLLLLFLAIIFTLDLSARREVSPEMMAVRKLYITGDNPRQVEWAYKHFPDNKGSCVKPVGTPEEADAILRIDPQFGPRSQAEKYEAPISVSCSSSANRTVCSDSTGYEMVTSCSTDRSGSVSCSSSYGPSLGATVADAISDYARSTFVVVSLYSKDGSKKIWTDGGDSTYMHTWAYSLSKAVGCVQQKCPVTHFKPCDTRWYDPSQLGPDGKLKR